MTLISTVLQRSDVRTRACRCTRMCLGAFTCVGNPKRNDCGSQPWLLACPCVCVCCQCCIVSMFHTPFWFPSRVQTACSALKAPCTFEHLSTQQKYLEYSLWGEKATDLREECMQICLFFNSANKDGFFFFCLRKGSSLLQFVACSREGTEHFAGHLINTLFPPLPPPICPIKPGSFGEKSPRGNNRETFPLSNDPDRETITADLGGASGPDFHLDSQQLNENEKNEAFLRPGLSSPSAPRPLSSEDKSAPLKQPVPRRRFRLRPSKRNNESPQLGGRHVEIIWSAETLY